VAEHGDSTRHFAHCTPRFAQLLSLLLTFSGTTN
jgi:hypothetical protein